MAQKHLQLLRNNTPYSSYTAAYDALKAMTGTTYADGTPIIARYSGNTDEIKTLFGIVNKKSGDARVDIINDVQASILRAYNLEDATSGAIETNDSIEVALNKLENQVKAAKAAATTKVVEGTDTGNNMTIVPTTGDDNSVTYTVNLTDVASKNALDAEIQARKDVDGQTGQTYAANADANYISEVGSLNAADVALDTALKAEETARRNIEGQNGSTYTQNAGSRYISGASSMNDADVRLDQAVSALSDNLDDIVEGLTASTVFDENKVVVDVTQEDGKISATTANLTSVKLGDYAEGTDADVAATDTLGEALGKLQAQINAMDKTASAVDGQVVTTVAEEDGKVTETKANVKDLQLGGYSKDTTATGAIGSTDTINTALSKLENTVTANKIANADRSINVTTAATGTDINVNIKSGEHVLAKGGNAGLYTDLDLIKITDSLPTNVKERYQLLATDDTQIGQNIDIYKDNTLKSVALEDQELVFTYIVDSGESVVRVDVSKFLTETEFGSGVTANSDGYVHGVVDQNSEAFLTVGADGFKLSGVQDAINTAISGLDVSDAAVAGQYVSTVSETDGKIAVSRANVSEAVLNNYTNGSDSTAVDSGDTINEAISKLENQVDKAKAAATTVVEHNTGNTHVTVSSSTASDGHTIYTVNEDDIASATALTDEISYRKAVDGVNGNAYTADTNAHYISDASNLYTADQALDTALYNESTARTAAIQALDAEESGATDHVSVKVTEVDGVITDVTVTETDIASESELYGLSAKTFTAAAMTGGTVSTATTNDGTVQLNINTDGSQVKLTGYQQGSESGAPVATDSVNAAIAKLYNRTLGTEVKAGSATTVSPSATGTTVDVKLDTTTEINEYDAAHAQAVNNTSKNVLEITQNGLYLNNNWDCGTY